jgi:hypothetical protein
MIILKTISVLPVAKIFCVMHAVIGLILGLIVTLGSLTGQEYNGVLSIGPWSILVFPIANSILGFLTGLFIAGGYNLISKWVGSIEIEIEQKEEEKLPTLSRL